MPKLYKAIDGRDGAMSRFIVLDSGRVSVAFWQLSTDGHIRAAKALISDFQYEQASRFNDAIDPILIAEW